MTSRSDLKEYARFRAVCECGKKSPRMATQLTVAYWMRDHEQIHRLAAAPINDF
jgi:hypothetical protein